MSDPVTITKHLNIHRALALKTVQQCIKIVQTTPCHGALDGNFDADGFVKMGYQREVISNLEAFKKKIIREAPEMEPVTVVKP